MKSLASSALLLVASASLLCAAPKTFDFKDPKGVNALSFNLDAVVEPIAGTATGVTGSVSFDPENPGATTGKISVPTKSLSTTNSTMTEHLHGDKWLDATKNPEISFEIVKLSNVKTEKNVTTAEAAGKLTIKGVTKDVTVPVKLTYLEGQLSKRVQKMEGDLLVVRGDFTISRKDFNIQPGQNEDRVSNEIAIAVRLAGAAPKA